MVKTGSPNRLIVSFHIGTVNTRISVAIVNAEGGLKISRVHSPSSGSSFGSIPNIPSCIAYDQAGNVHGAGTKLDQTTHEGLHFVRCFKFHLFPAKTLNAARVQRVQKQYPLPGGKTIVDIYSDFLRYLKDYTLTYLEQEHHFSCDEVVYVLSYPTPDSIPILEAAALKAELVPSTGSERKRLHLVAELEAAAQILPDLAWPLEDGTREKEAFIVVKAGGGTLSVGTFCVEPTAKGASSSISAVTATESYLEGALLVTERARSHINNLLRDSLYHSSIEAIMREFDARTMLGFRRFKGYQYIPFGESTDHNEECGVHYGHLVLQGTDVARFFEPSISCVVRAVLNQLFDESASKKGISTIVLLGGLFRNEWVFTRLRNTLEALGLECYRPPKSSDSPIADGAVRWYVHKELHPPERISQYHYGIRIPIPYDELNSDHVSRSWETFRGMDGRMWLGHYFSVVLPKGRSTPKTREYRHTFTTNARRRTGLESLNVTILRHPDDSCPVWANNSIFDGFETTCTMHANTFQASRRLQAHKSPFRTSKGWSYYKLSFDVIIRFGPDEFTAQLAWNEDGREKRGEVYKVEGNSGSIVN